MKNRLILMLLVALLATAGRPAAAGNGATLNLDAYAGKVVVVDFWASWCAPCRRSFPWLNAMKARYEALGLVIIAVNTDSERADAEEFLRNVPAEFEIVYDPRGEIARAWNVLAMPSSYVLGRDGELIARHFGFRTRRTDEYEAVLRDALAARP